MRISGWTILLALTASLISSSTVSHTAEEQKMKPEELVARHLEAAGLAGDVLQSRTSLRASGTGTSRYMTGGKGGPYSGSATLLSQGTNLLLRVPYSDPLYQGELVAYDGKEVRATDTPLGRLAY